MPLLASSQVPPPKSWDEFEDIALAASRLRWTLGVFSRNGRQGQAQNGVDISSTAGGATIGVQCKNTVDGVSLAVVNAEIAEAEEFEPKLDRLFIATTAKRDARLQKEVRLLSQAREKNEKFPVEILFWDDIYAELAKDPKVYFTFYPQFRAGDDKARAHDEQLFQSLTTLLHSDGVIGFLTEHSLASAFRNARLDQLYDFHHGWNKPEREFLDAELDGLRKSLWTKVDTLVKLIGQMTIPLDSNANFQTIPPEWKYKLPDMYRDAVSALNKAARDVVDAHREMVRRGRANLLA